MANNTCSDSVNELIVGNSIAQPPAKTLPSVPIAHDMKSLIAAVNALRTIINSMIGATQQNQGAHRIGGTTTKPGQAVKPVNAHGRYVEVNRATEVVRVTDPTGNSDAYIDFVRINKVTMRDNLTGETWDWIRGGH